MKNHQQVETIRVCDLKPGDKEVVGSAMPKDRLPSRVKASVLEVGWRFIFTGSEYEVTKKNGTIVCQRIVPDTGHYQGGSAIEFGLSSQVTVQLVWIIRQSAMNKINQHEYETEKTNGLPVIENGKVCH